VGVDAIWKALAMLQVQRAVEWERIQGNPVKASASRAAGAAGP
jgi:hypothetical protein